MSALSPPEPDLRACVVVPARNEEELIGACLDALAGQRGPAAPEYEVLLVLDACTDDTEARARAAGLRHPELRLRLLAGPAAGAGAARRLGMEAACARLEALGRTHGLIASTDADSRVAPDWLAAQLAAVARGARAIGGRVELGADGADALAPGVRERRARAARARHERVREAARPERGDRAEHWQFSGASMAVTAATYRAVGGLPAHVALEDEGFERALTRAGVPIERLIDVRVSTSARLRGRATRGLACDLALSSWLATRSLRSEPYTLSRLLAAKRSTVSVVLPAREVAATLPAVLATLVPLRDAGLVDELIVVDAGSRDGTARVAESAGVDVYQESELLPEHGPALGKGDAMWRGLAATRGDIVIYLDTDSADVTPAYPLGLLGPLLEDEGIALVKGAFRRPFQAGDTHLPDEGGRVTELVARPLLNLCVPELTGFRQPLAGEVAARRELLEALSFPVGYGVEIAMMIDACRRVGLDALAQVDLGVRRNRHQPLRELSAMAYAVMVTALRRVVDPALVEAFAPGSLALWHRSDLELRQVALDERPALAAAGAVGRYPQSVAGPR